MTIASNIDGLGTVYADDYEVGDYTLFGNDVDNTYDDASFFASRTWKGAYDSDWDDDRNWTRRSVPDATTDVSIHKRLLYGNDPVINNVTGEGKNFTINSNNSLTVTGAGTLTVDGVQIINAYGASMTVDGGNCNITGTQVINQGTFNIQNGSDVSVTVPSLTNQGTISLSGDNNSLTITGDLNMANGSTLNIQGDSNVEIKEAGGQK
jgi:hypothetical protein